MRPLLEGSLSHREIEQALEKGEMASILIVTSILGSCVCRSRDTGAFELPKMTGD